MSEGNRLFFSKSSNRWGPGLEARRGQFETQSHFGVTILVFPGMPYASSLLSPPASGHSQNASRDPGECDAHAATTGAEQETTQRNASRWKQRTGPRQPLGAYQVPYKESARMAQKEVQQLKQKLMEKDMIIQQLERELMMKR